MGIKVSKTSGAKGNGGSGIKRALLVGCNYPNSKAELAGCTNDVAAWYKLLTECLGFESSNITILVDDGPGDYELSTGKNIKDELNRIVEASQPRDIIFFQFSGHGVQIPADEGGDYEADGLDEALCPTDLNLIIDDDLRDILSTLDPEVKFTMISDCCHSGGMLDHEEIVIKGRKSPGPLRRIAGTRDRGLSWGDLKKDIDMLKGSTKQKNRSLDVETLVEMFGQSHQMGDLASKSLTSSKTIRAELYKVYGENASNVALAVKKRDMSPERASHIHYAGPGKKPTDHQIDPNKGILITGCQASETSADVTDVEGRSFGALSHLAIQVIRRHKKKHGDAPLSNKHIVLKIRELLENACFEQNPCLECSRSNSEENFVLW